MKINKALLGLSPACSFIIFHMASSCRKKKFYPIAVRCRGSLNSNRDWWDVLKYELYVEPDLRAKSIEGSVRISFRALANGATLQLDFQQPMVIDSIPGARYERDGNIALVSLIQPVNKGDTKSLNVYFHGKPREASLHPGTEAGSGKETGKAGRGCR